MLRNEQRNKVQPAEEIIERMSPSPREVAADVGTGTGYITLPLTHKVRMVVAMDSQEEMLETLMSSASPEERDKIRLVKGEMPRLPFSDASLDRVILVNVIHELEDKPRLVSEVRRVLKKGGHVSIVDFHKEETSFGPPVEERLTEEEMLSLFAPFQTIRRWSFPEYYQLELKAR
jgi:ubiquinone/menaquinone biosynthesis C-methylase UbiE